jgi:two-component system, response regulator YesN
MQETFFFYNVELDWNNVGILLNCIQNKDVNFRNIHDEVICKLKIFEEYLSSVFEIFAFIGVSDGHVGIVNISKAYIESEESLNYAITKNFFGVNSFRNIKSQSKEYGYTLEVEKQLINFIKAGEKEQIIKLLDDIYEQTFKRADISVALCKCISYDIASTVLKLSNDPNMSEHTLSKIYEIEIISKEKNASLLYGKLKDTILDVCDHVNINKKSHNTILKEDLVKLIKDNFDKNYMSLTWVSNELDVNPTYASLFFKEQLGETFIQYLTRLRIDKAKQLLLLENKKIQEIADEIGYANSGVLIKVFKKLEGCTPGSYRNNYKNKD